MKHLVVSAIIGLLILNIIMLAKPARNILVQQITVPAGETALDVCAVDKSGILRNVQFAVYDTQGRFIERAYSDGIQPCVRLPQALPAGDYLFGLFSKH